MGNDFLHIEPGLQHGEHLIPGLEHLAAIDALDGEGFEDHAVPIDRRRPRRNAIKITNESRSLLDAYGGSNCLQIHIRTLAAACPLTVTERICNHRCPLFRQLVRLQRQSRHGLTVALGLLLTDFVAESI